MFGSSSSSSGGAAMQPAKQITLSIHDPVSIVRFIAGVHKSLHNYPHYITQTVRDNELPDSIVDIIYDGGKIGFHGVWAVPPRGANGSAKTVANVRMAKISSASAANNSNSSSNNEQQQQSNGEQTKTVAEQIAMHQSAHSRVTSWEIYKEKVSGFMHWITSTCMDQDTNIRAYNDDKITECLNTFDLVRFLHELKRFIANGTRGNARTLFEGLVQDPDILALETRDDFTHHIANFKGAVDCLETVGSTYTNKDIVTGFLASLGSEFDSIKAVMVDRQSREPIDLKTATNLVSTYFDSSIINGINKNNNKTSVKQKSSETYRVNMAEGKSNNEKNKDIPCKFYMSGVKCYRGDSCRYRHNPSDAAAFRQAMSLNSHDDSRDAKRDRSNERSSRSSRDNQQRDRGSDQKRGGGRNNDRSERDSQKNSSTKKRVKIEEQESDTEDDNDDRDNSNKSSKSRKKSYRKFESEF